jgi:hypothetical protein
VKDGRAATGDEAAHEDVQWTAYQGQRLARYAAVVAVAREADAFRVKRPRPERFQAAALA